MLKREAALGAAGRDSPAGSSHSALVFAIRVQYLPPVIACYSNFCTEDPELSWGLSHKFQTKPQL